MFTGKKITILIQNCKCKKKMFHLYDKNFEKIFNWQFVMRKIHNLSTAKLKLFV